MLAIDRSELQRGADGHFSGAVVWSGHNMRPSPFLVLPSILEENVIQGVHAVAAALTFDERPDSVDGHPAHEFYVIKDGVIQEDAHALAELLQPALHTLRHLADRSPICASSARGRCTPCTCLIRRYRPFERRSHYEHVDGHAAVTAVVSLSRRSGYQGGLFLSNLTTRWWLPLDDGEAVVHASDLFHGVQVTEGERWSLVVWFRTCARCTMAGAGMPADREAVPRTAFSAAPIGTGSAASSTPVVSAVVSADGSGGPSGGPSVGSRAAYDLARLLLRGVEFGWPSPLPESSQDPCVRAAELLTAAAADGHVRARAELSANKGRPVS